jgi:hypothetical protein
MVKTILFNSLIAVGFVSVDETPTTDKSSPSKLIARIFSKLYSISSASPLPAILSITTKT